MTHKLPQNLASKHGHMTHLVDLNSNYELPKYQQLIVTTPYHIPRVHRH